MSVADPTAVRLADQHAHGHKKTSGRSVSGSTTVCLPNMTARADAFAPPTATFPLHDVTDCFRTRPDGPTLTVLADHGRGKRSLQIAARHPSRAAAVVTAPGPKRMGEPDGIEPHT